MLACQENLSVSPSAQGTAAGAASQQDLLGVDLKQNDGFGDGHLSQLLRCKTAQG